MNLSRKKKRHRVWTNRDYPDGKSFELIEKDDDGLYYWRMVDWTLYADGEEAIPVEVCFPVSAAIVAEKLKEAGREFKP